jgi:hypothetical protein
MMELGSPRILPGCSVLPPMEESDDMARPTNKPTRKPSKASKPKGKRKKTAGRFDVINAFADFTLAKLDRADIAVWLLLWRDTKPNGIATTSQVDLARRAGTSTRTVERVIAKLGKLGLVTMVRRGGVRQGASSYRIHPLAGKITRHG